MTRLASPASLSPPAALQPPLSRRAFFRSSGKLRHGPHQRLTLCDANARHDRRTSGNAAKESRRARARRSRRALRPASPPARRSPREVATARRPRRPVVVVLVVILVGTDAAGRGARDGLARLVIRQPTRSYYVGGGGPVAVRPPNVLVDHRPWRSRVLC